MLNSRIALIIFSFALVVQMNGQDEKDSQLWLSGSSSIKISKKFRVKATTSIRFNDNWTHRRSTYFQVAPRYVLNKMWTTSVYYRFNARDAYTANDHRMGIRFSASEREKPLNFGYTTKLEFNRHFSSDPDGRNDWTWRNRFGVEYQRKKKHRWVPSVLVEFFNRKSTEGGGWPLSRVRGYFGLSYNPKGPWAFEVEYIKQESRRRRRRRRRKIKTR